MRRSVFAAFIAIALTSPALRAQTASPLAERIGRIINRPEFRHAMWGIEIYDLDAGKPVYTLNEDKLFTPGSTTKLLTVGTALGLLGADYRFHTKVYRTGAITSDGVLHGDLVLVASGDPNLSQRMRSDGTLAFENHDHSYGGDPTTRAVPGDPLTVIKSLAKQIASKKIRVVTGAVIVDASLYREGTRELGTGVVVSPLSVNDNVIDVTVSPGNAINAMATISVSPMSGYARFVSVVTTSAAGSAPRIRMNDVENADGSVTVTVSGTFPANTSGILYSYPVPKPSRFGEVALAEALQANGVRADANRVGASNDFAAMARVYVDSNVVAEHVSAPVSEMAKVILKVSQNMHASAMPNLLGAVLGKAKGQTGFDLEREFLTGAGLDVSGAQQADGAGGDAHYTPSFMVSYLAMMSKRPDFQVFHDALPILGKDGTLFNIQTASPAAGHVHAKTGTFVVSDPLNRAMLVTGKGLAGYLTSAAGRRLTIAVFANNVLVSTAPDEVTRVVGQALGEVAAAAYEAR
jgi:PBP4 family serine-type D-alanyl-D-alanine carboxypeptidase